LKAARGFHSGKKKIRTAKALPECDGIFEKFIKNKINAYMKHSTSIFASLFSLYYEGFRNLSGWGRKVWIIILIKLFIMFAILKLFFFPDFLQKKFDNDKQRSEYVMDKLINSH
jgi:hypothetical protein